MTFTAHFRYYKWIIVCIWNIQRI